MPLHLDNAGAPMIIPQIIDAWSLDVKSTLIPNPHSLGSEYISKARQTILAHLNTCLEEYSVIFTQNSTSALGIVANSIDWKGKLYSYHPHSHTSVLGIRQIAESRGGSFECSSVPTGFLYAYPAQSNFCGTRFPFPVDTDSLILVDTASLLSTTKFDLSKHKADFALISFYKMFGFPTGLGALIVKNEVLEKHMTPASFGGGSVLGCNTSGWNVSKGNVHGFELGTIPFLEIKAVLHGFEYINSSIGWDWINQHTGTLAEQARQAMAELKYSNDAPLVEFYPKHKSNLGPIVNFNLLNADGSYIGYSTLSKLAEMSSIVLRVGCFCNPGACQEYLSTDAQQTFLVHGHVCGDDVDVIDGTATGSCRISFGFQNTVEHVREWREFLQRYFLQQSAAISRTIRTPVVSGIAVYPIKSCAAMILDASFVSCFGLSCDRQWVLVKDGRALTQTLCPRMCLIKPLQFVNGNLLVKVGNVCISLSPPSHTSTSAVKVCGKSKPGICSSSLVDSSALISDFLGVKCSLVYASDASFSNHSSSLLLISQSSVDYLDKQSPNRIRASNFRANLIVSNINPFAEQTWIGSELKVGDARFKVESACQRCRMVCVDQDTGNVEKDTLSTLAIHHRVEGRIVFGIYLTPLNSGLVKVGHEVIISE